MSILGRRFFSIAGANCLWLYRLASHQLHVRGVTYDRIVKLLVPWTRISTYVNRYNIHRAHPSLGIFPLAVRRSTASTNILRPFLSSRREKKASFQTFFSPFANIVSDVSTAGMMFGITILHMTAYWAYQTLYNSCTFGYGQWFCTNPISNIWHTEEGPFKAIHSHKDFRHELLDLYPCSVSGVYCTIVWWKKSFYMLRCHPKPSLSA